MSINKKELVRRLSKRTAKKTDAVEAMVDAVVAEIYAALEQRESVSIRNFGTFYIQDRGSSCVFKFNPAQRLCKLLGRSSSYKGEV